MVGLHQQIELHTCAGKVGDNSAHMSQDDGSWHDSDDTRDNYQISQPYGGLFTDVSTRHDGPSPIVKYATGKLNVQAYLSSSRLMTEYTKRHCQ